MKKIMIIGCGGAGKSTFARKLGDALGISVHHLDSLFWKKGWVPTEREEWKAALSDVMSENSWIMDGNYGSTMDIRLKEADTIIFLDYSTLTCLYGAVSRRIKYHGRTRPDMGEGCPEKLDAEFLKWIALYRRDKAPVIRQTLSQLKGKKVFIFENRKQTHHFLNLCRR
ncbi:DNA topology modulation protein [Peribacillus sp. SCS-26]|uniref:DNA topology modulation protein n=1 Tax=Paraperibacillus marinus TaxID=3115295 RepID=UPI0039062707